MSQIVFEFRRVPSRVIANASRVGSLNHSLDAWLKFHRLCDWLSFRGVLFPKAGEENAPVFGAIVVVDDMNDAVRVLLAVGVGDARSLIEPQGSVLLSMGPCFTSSTQSEWSRPQA